MMQPGYKQIVQHRIAVRIFETPRHAPVKNPALFCGEFRNSVAKLVLPALFVAESHRLFAQGNDDGFTCPEQPETTAFHHLEDQLPALGRLLVEDRFHFFQGKAGGTKKNRSQGTLADCHHFVLTECHASFLLPPANIRFRPMSPKAHAGYPVPRSTGRAQY